jgi:hypothetical protein
MMPLAILAGVTGVWIGMTATQPLTLRIAVSAAPALLLLVTTFTNPDKVVFALWVWLPALGTIRRLASFFRATGGNDPLLLVAPVAVVALVAVAAQRGAFERLTALSKAVAIFCGLILISVINPLQGGLTVGIGGLLFVLVPVLWFWVARGFVDDAMMGRIVQVVAFAAVLAAFYGLYQTYVGLPIWDQKWVFRSGYQALDVFGSTRAFSSFSAASEYATFIAAGLVVWLVWMRRVGWAAIAGAAVALLAWALFLESIRAEMFLTAAAVGMILAARTRLGLGGGAIMAGLMIVLLMTGVGRLAGGAEDVGTATTADARTKGLLEHQVNGLANPLDPEHSTLLVHTDLFVKGITGAVSYPLGKGVGAITLSASKFSGGKAAQTEADFSNVASALGFPGLITFIVITVLGLRAAFRAAKDSTALPLMGLGFLIVAALQWTAGGQYAVAPLPWMVMGWLDGRHMRAEIAAADAT